MLPSIRSYGNYSSSNYGAHTLEVSVGNLTIYFSYKTPVAFETPGHLVVSENVWGNTTGKHLNWINSDKSNRLDRGEFEKQLNEVMEKYNV